jgi:hypothetical protein
MAEESKIRSQVGGNILHKPPTKYVVSFTLENFQIKDTRAPHNDTDFVSIGVTVGSNPPITSPTLSMGDLNNGTYNTNLTIPNVQVDPDETVVFTYSIVNSGYDKDSFEQAMKTAFGDASTAAATAVGKLVDTATDHLAGSIGSAAATWFLGKIGGIFFPDCDGTVAAAQHGFTGASLGAATANGVVLRKTDENKGTDSQTGCGGNSHYFVTWSAVGHSVAVEVLKSR